MNDYDILDPNGLNTEPVAGSDPREAEPAVDDMAEECGVPVTSPVSNRGSVKTSASPTPPTPRLGDLIGWEQVQKLAEQRERSRARAVKFRRVQAAGRVALSRRGVREH
jgi:hypothetical protein